MSEISSIETVEATALETLFDSLPELCQRAGDAAEAALLSGVRQPESMWKIGVTPYALALMLGMEAARATPAKTLQSLTLETLSILSSQQATCIEKQDENLSDRLQAICYQLWEQGTDDDYIRTVSAILSKSQSREQSERIGRAIWLAGFWEGFKVVETSEVFRHGTVN